MSLPNIKIWRENATLGYDDLDDDERLCVQINKVSVWLESKYVISVSPSSKELKKRIR